MAGGTRKVVERSGVSWVTVLVAIALLAAVGGGGWFVFFKPKNVPTVAVMKGTVVRAFYATGVVRPDFEYDVKSKAQGALVGFSKREGSLVKKGELIATVDDKQLKSEVEKFRAEVESAKRQAAEEAPLRLELLAKLNEAKQQLEISQRTLDRMLASFEKQAATMNDVDEARKSHVQWSNTIAALESQLGSWKIESQRKVDVASADLRKADGNLADAEVRAPIDGVILERYVENQEVVGLNQKLVLIAAADDLLMKAAVDEEDVTRAHVGQRVEMQLYAFQDRDGSGTPIILRGKVREILPSANPTNKTYEVKVEFMDRPEGLRVGMTGELNFVESETAKDAALLVPSSAVLDKKVYRSLGAGRFEATAVRTGIRTLEQVEILEGVREGEEIVRDAKMVAPVKLPPAKQPVVPTRTGDETAER